MTRALQDAYAYHEFTNLGVEDLNYSGSPDYEAQLIQLKATHLSWFVNPDGDVIIRMVDGGPLVLFVTTQPRWNNSHRLIELFIDDELKYANLFGTGTHFNASDNSVRVVEDARPGAKIRFRMTTWKSGALFSVQDSELGTITNNSGNADAPMFDHIDSGWRERSFIAPEVITQEAQHMIGPISSVTCGFKFDVREAEMTPPDPPTIEILATTKIGDHYYSVFAYTNPNPNAIEVATNTLVVDGVTQNIKPGAGPGLRFSDSLGDEDAFITPQVMFPGESCPVFIIESGDTGADNYWEVTVSGHSPVRVDVDFDDVVDIEDFRAATVVPIHVFSFRNRRYQELQLEDPFELTVEVDTRYGQDDSDVTNVVIDPATREPFRLSKRPNTDFGAIPHWNHFHDAIRVQGGWLFAHDGAVSRFLPAGDLRNEFEGAVV